VRVVVSGSRSLAARALMALLLTVGFYVLAIGISGVLLWLPYAEVTYLGRIHFKLALACILGAGAVLWAIVPRPDRFEPPGPRLTRASAPALFSLIDRIARTTSQPPPEEVYLLNDANAFVTQRGGVMGFGSRRVMGVGLPLLAHLLPAELTAVIAHEFGHYVSGDVGLGPWIYKTRGAIVRAVAATDDTWLAAPFRAYARLFLKMTLAVSREQEFVADRTAAQVAGSAAAASALRRVAALGPAYSAYLNAEVAPILQSGFLPPIAAGFGQYLDERRVAAAMQTAVDERTIGGEAGEYDSHPPIADRIRALESGPEQTAPNAGVVPGPALSQLDVHAKTLLRFTLGNDVMARLKPIAWKDVGATVYVKCWHDLAREYASWFGRRTVDSIPSGQQVFVQLGSELVGREEAEVDAAARAERAVRLFTAGLGSALTRAGWALETGPGRPLELVKDGHRLEPGALVMRLATAKETTEGWRVTCQALGISGLPFVSEAPAKMRAAG
jgi:heat shock protein HtpX